MRRDYGSVGTIALRASALLQAMSRDIEAQRKEFNLTQYHQTYTRNAVAKLPKLSRRIVELAVKEMEDSGYEFNKKQVGNVERKRLVRTVLIFTESSDQLSRATDRVPGLPASPGYVQ